MATESKGSFIDRFANGMSDDAKFFLGAALAGHMMNRRKKAKKAAAVEAAQKQAATAKQKSLDKAALDYADNLDRFADRMDGGRHE